MRQVYTMFVEYVNTHGGVTVAGKRYHLELTIMDDRSDPVRVAAITNHLIYDRGIKFLFNPYSSGNTKPMATLAHAAGVVMIGTGSSSPDNFVNRPTIFGLECPYPKYFQASIEMR